MLKTLIKKQFTEVFRSYFYDAKKNRMRSKGAVIAFFAFFIILMVGMLGGMFTMLALTLCPSLLEVNMGWLYFLILGGLAIVFGAFGSVFNTYSGLYLSKDNDLLLSLPIPVKTIITARLVNVYLMGTMYSAIVLIPTLVVYWIKAGVTAPRVICGILFFLIVTMIVLILSCLLGWVVARISLKLKNKSFITVLLALAFIGLYYFFYFKASALIQDLIANAVVYGEKVKGAANILYLFGRIGEGSFGPALGFLAVTALLFFLVCLVITRSFFKIAASSGVTAKVRYVEKKAKSKTAFRALLGKEFGKLVSSPNYMLNCGLGILLYPAAGVGLILKGGEISSVFDKILPIFPGITAVLICVALCALTSMIDMAAPSVSLEGKNLWIPQSLPVEGKTVLKAKAGVQLILTAVPLLFAAVCAAVFIKSTFIVRILVILLPLSYAVFAAAFNTFLSVRMANFNWTNEIIPIKQSGAVTIAIFANWGVTLVMGGLYFLIGTKLGAALYLALWTVLFSALDVLLVHWLGTRGGTLFNNL